MNGNRSVHIVTHSLGGPTTLFFLNAMTQEWKDTYIKTFTPIAGPWAGASAALRAVVSTTEWHYYYANDNCRSLVITSGLPYTIMTLSLISS